MGELNKDAAVDLLNRILEQELAGVVRYTHYSLLVFGFNRIPIVAWLRMLGRWSRPRNCTRARSTKCFANPVRLPPSVLRPDNLCRDLP